MWAGLFIIVFALVAGQLLYTVYYFIKASYYSTKQFTDTIERGDGLLPPLRIFIGGDSIGAGVGATSIETTIAGRLADHFSKTHHVVVMNAARSGMKMRGLATSMLPTAKQDICVLIVSSNDLFRLTNKTRFKEATAEVLSRFAPCAKTVIVVGPAHVATSKALPVPARIFYWFKWYKYEEIIANEAVRYPNIRHVAPFGPPAGTFAGDKFHPNDEGYRVWFEAIKKAIEDA